MSSPYAVLKDRSLDQWKVTELKEELKKRKLTIKGLKEDLVKRLDEAVRHEREESEKENDDNGLASSTQQELTTELGKEETIISGSAEVPLDIQINSTEKVDNETEKETNEHGEPSTEVIVLEVDGVNETDTTELEQEHPAESDGLETTVVSTVTVESVTTVTETYLVSEGNNEMSDSTAQLENSKTNPSDTNNELPLISENNTSVISPTRSSLQDKETPSEAADSTVQLENDDSRFLQSDQSAPPSKYQVSKVDPALGFQVVSDSVSTESVSIIRKNEIKADVISDNAKLELDNKSQLSDVTPDGGESHPMDVEEPLAKIDVERPLDIKESMADIRDIHPENEDGLNDIDIGNLDPPEKLNLEDDSMEEDIVDTKETESKMESEIAGDVENSEIVVQKEENFVDVVEPVKKVVLKAENEPAGSSFKRKFDKEEVDTAKKPRKWNVEDNKGSEPHGASKVVDLSKPSFKRFARSDSLVNEEPPKERVVPPSAKSPSNSLRIDQFLRPFTLKAVQELLGKMGSVTSFWMDNIKTHCYVSYSSVEEAVETRNAVYNLQWPPNGGRLLVADFVDPQEVKNHIEASLSSPAATTPSTTDARQQLSRKQLPPPSLPPPPSLANPPPVRERLNPPVRDNLLREQHPLPARDRLNLPPPTPLSEKVELPIVTLDDLFRKTIAIPRIYYLPLSDEQVAAKLMSKGNVNQ